MSRNSGYVIFLVNSIGVAVILVLQSHLIYFAIPIVAGLVAARFHLQRKPNDKWISAAVTGAWVGMLSMILPETMVVIMEQLNECTPNCIPGELDWGFLILTYIFDLMFFAAFGFGGGLIGALTVLKKQSAELQPGKE